MNVLNREMYSSRWLQIFKSIDGFGGKWDYSSLNQFLLKPKECAEGD